MVFWYFMLDINKVYEKLVSIINCFFFNLNYVVDFICFLRVDLIVRDKFDKVF